MELILLLAHLQQCLRLLYLRGADLKPWRFVDAKHLLVACALRCTSIWILRRHVQACHHRSVVLLLYYGTALAARPASHVCFVWVATAGANVFAGSRFDHAAVEGLGNVELHGRTSLILPNRISSARQALEKLLSTP